jgi:tRNA(fMet)-specific endonuclease VapC
MKYSLDTNTRIRYINGRAREIVVCSVVRGELAFGAAKSQTPQRSAEKQLAFLEPYATLPYDDLAAGTLGQIRAYLEKRGALRHANRSDCAGASPDSGDA